MKDDNLLCLEMKKSYESKNSKDKDRKRLRELTSDKSNTNEINYNYLVGIYYEYDSDKNEIRLEIYEEGQIIFFKLIQLNKSLDII